MNRNAKKSVTEDDLLRFVDGDLSPDERARIEAYLEDNEDARKRVAADRGLRQDMRAAFDGLGLERIPSRLDIGRLQTGNRRRLIGHSTRAAAFLLVALASGLAGWHLKPDAKPPIDQAFLADALAAYRTYVVEVAHPVEVTAERRGHLSTWLTNRLERPFKVPDLRVSGLELVGGRLLPAKDSPAAQLMYETREGERVTLYLRRGDGGDPQFRFARSDTANAFYWSDSAFSYALTGKLERSRLLDVAHLLQSQMKELEGM